MDSPLSFDDTGLCPQLLSNPLAVMSDTSLLHWFVLLGPLWPLVQAVLGHNSPLGQLVLTFDI